MRLNRIAIRQLLLVTAIFIGIMLLLIAVITNKYLRQSFNHFEMLTQIERVQSLGLLSRNLEKEFLISETSNESFFSTGESNCFHEYMAYSDEISKDLLHLRDSKIIQSLGLTSTIDTAVSIHRQYVSVFGKTVNLIKERGFKGYGIIGDFRQSIHMVEDEFSTLNNYYYTAQMLTLRRHEKDYLLRKDLAYHQKFHDRLEQLLSEIKGSKNIQKSHDLVTLLMNYGSLFDKLIEVDKKIGYTSKQGMLTQLNTLGNSVDKVLSSMHSDVFKHSKSKINEAVVLLFLFIGVLSVFAVVIIWLTSRHIVKSLGRLQSYITRLGKGDLPEKIDVRSNDEISQMERSINVLTKNLRNTRKFAVEVGNGNLESDVNVFGNKGELGGALIDMRKKLLQVAKEREAQSVETNRRMWANEGMAIFTDILRERNKKLEDFAFDVVKNLVKYTNSSLASLFMMAEDDDSKPCLNLLATYAYDRRKYVNSRVYLNEGLVGVCALEAETTMFTEIPKDYIKINSGLGYASPTCIILVPLKVDQNVVGVVEMASFNVYQPFEVEFIEKVLASTASTLQMVTINNQTKMLLEQTQQQAEELQAQEEEMRQNMEEMRTTQEWMNTKEEELNANLRAKEDEIKQLVSKAEDQKKLFDDRVASLELMIEFYNQHFMMAELNPRGEVKIGNDRFFSVLSNRNGENIDSIFDNSINGFEQSNRLEWERVANGETYKGLIHRLDSVGNKLEIFAIFSPVLNCFGQVEKVMFVGFKVGFAEDKCPATGAWFKDDEGSLVPVDFARVLLS